MKPITIELEHFELRILKGMATRQVRSPENLARYLIAKGLGIVSDEQAPTNANSDTYPGQGNRVAVAA